MDNYDKQTRDQVIHEQTHMILEAKFILATVASSIYVKIKQRNAHRHTYLSEENEMKATHFLAT